MALDLAPWRALAREMAEPWPALQNPDGTFPDYVEGGAPGFGARYGESMLGYGLLLTGVREDDNDLIDAGLKGLTYAVGRSDLQESRPSVFENLAVAAAYNIARRKLSDYGPFTRHKRDWQHWLRKTRMLRVDTTHRFVNKQVVEAAGVWETLRTKLNSSQARAVLGGERARARRLAVDLVNHRVPAIAARDGVIAAGARTLVLSDPPSNPPAYHALSLGFYARALDLIGTRATGAARDALRQIVQASWWLTGPDGDLSYMGRSQEQAWTLACTAYGAEVAASLPGSDARTRKRYRALSERALGRLRDIYGVGPTGLWITPALGRNLNAGLRGLDGYAGASVYGGLTLVALEWALEAMAGQAREAGAIAADSPGAVRLSRRDGELSVVRTDDTWFAVKRAPNRDDFPEDLRYDFGLVALKAGNGGGFHDVLPIRPRTTRRPDSLGPVLRRGNRRGMPFGKRMRVDDAGKVTIRGGFVTSSGSWLRRNVLFRFEPVPGGVRLVFPASAGDRFEYSVFFRDRASPPQVDDTSVSDDTLRVECDEELDVELEDGYSSGSEPKLVRARLSFRADADGPVRLTLSRA